MLLSHRTNHDHLFHTLSILLLSNSWKERRSGSDSHGSNCLGVDYLLLLPWGVSCSRKSIIKVVVPRSSLLRCFPWVILDVCATMSPEHLLLCCSWWVGAWKAWSHLGDLGIDIMYTSQSWLSNQFIKETWGCEYHCWVLRVLKWIWASPLTRYWPSLNGSKYRPGTGKKLPPTAWK